MAYEPSSHMQAGPRGQGAAPLHDDEVTRWLRPLGAVARVATYALIFLVLWRFRPDDISHVPLAALTLAQIAKTLAWIAAALLSGHALLNPTRDEAVLKGWGVFGLVLTGVLAIAAVFWAGAIR